MRPAFFVHWFILITSFHFTAAYAQREWTVVDLNTVEMHDSNLIFRIKGRDFNVALSPDELVEGSRALASALSWNLPLTIVEGNRRKLSFLVGEARDSIESGLMIDLEHVVPQSSKRTSMPGFAFQRKDGGPPVAIFSPGVLPALPGSGVLYFQRTRHSEMISHTVYAPQTIAYFDIDQRNLFGNVDAQGMNGELIRLYVPRATLRRLNPNSEHSEIRAICHHRTSLISIRSARVATFCQRVRPAPEVISPKINEPRRTYTPEEMQTFLEGMFDSLFGVLREPLQIGNIFVTPPTENDWDATEAFARIVRTNGGCATVYSPVLDSSGLWKVIRFETSPNTSPRGFTMVDGGENQRESAINVLSYILRESGHESWCDRAD